MAKPKIAMSKMAIRTPAMEAALSGIGLMDDNDERTIHADLSIDLGNAISNIETSTSISSDHRSIHAIISKSSRLNDFPLDSVFKYDGRWRVYGEACYTLAPDTLLENVDEGRYTSPWYRILTAAALYRAFHTFAGEGVVTPRTISSIPAVLFKNEDILKKITAALRGEYEMERPDGKTLKVRIDKLKIIPEGSGTYFGYLYGDGKLDVAFQKGRWAIEDEGFLSLDHIVFNGGNYSADDAHSDTNVGMFNVADAVQAFLHQQSGVAIPRAEVDVLMREDEVEINKRIYNIRDVRNQALADLGQRITTIIEQWSRNRNFAGIIFTGGGANLLAPYVTSNKLPTFVIAPNSPRANVEGAFQFMVHSRKEA